MEKTEGMATGIREPQVSQRWSSMSLVQALTTWSSEPRLIAGEPRKIGKGKVERKKIHQPLNNILKNCWNANIE